MNTPLDLSVIIVNYNTGAIIQNCIASVLQQQKIKHEIIVVDNASTDDSLERLQHLIPKISLIKSPENLGFGRANNLAFATCQGRYLLLLNPDAVLQSPHDLQNLVSFMDGNRDYGLAGPRVIKNNQDTLPRHFYPGQKYIKTDFSHLPGEIAWVIGACMIIRSEVFALVNGFDSDYFLYGEEADLCFRIRKNGYPIGYHDQIIVQHIGGASEKNTATSSLWYKKQKGLQLFYQKNYSAHDAKKAVQHDLTLARRHLFFLKLKKIFRLCNHNDFAKLARYQVVHDTSRDFLKNWGQA